jgi:hypothetical protein
MQKGRQGSAQEQQGRYRMDCIAGRQAALGQAGRLSRQAGKQAAKMAGSELSRQAELQARAIVKDGRRACSRQYDRRAHR